MGYYNLFICLKLSKLYSDFLYLQPAHIKTAFIGTSLSIPITEGKLNLGTWQGIWLCEHRDHAGNTHI